MEGKRPSMIQSRGLVLDANILLRAVFGIRALALIESYEGSVRFYAPDVCFRDARKYIPGIAAKRGMDAETCFVALDGIAKIVDSVDLSLYEDFEAMALLRIASRDVDDWPVVATALLLNAPIWTEDRDFFGTGIATWTSSRVEIFLMGE